MRQFKLLKSLLICVAWGLIIVPPITDKNWFSMYEKFCDLLFYTNSIPFLVPPHLTLLSTFWQIKRSKTKPSSV